MTELIGLYFLIGIGGGFYFIGKESPLNAIVFFLAWPVYVGSLLGYMCASLLDVDEE